MRVLAIDHGTARAGCAISDPTGTIARPLGVIEPPDPQQVAELVGEHGADLVVVGLPVSMDGAEGKQAADVLQTAIASASDKSSGIWATIVGVGTLLLTASGMFGEMQTALNKIWKADPKASGVGRLLRARAASLGLVAALGFLLIVSLVVSTAITAFGDHLNAVLPFGNLIISLINFLVSLALLSLLFAAIYKVLPDTSIRWRDVVLGGVVTAVLFTIGKSLIGWYLGSSAIASSYGAAGGLILLLFWIYYSAQIFLFGAEFTKVYANEIDGVSHERAETNAVARRETLKTAT